MTFSKCELFYASVFFMTHVISKERTGLSDGKVGLKGFGQYSTRSELEV